MQSAILWYDTFEGCLEDLGFKINTYDPCVANMMIGGKHCTIYWYVDDTKISHHKPKIVTEVISKVEERFGKMVVTRGKKHNFDGIDVEFMDNGTARILMKEYTTECLKRLVNKLIKRLALRINITYSK